MQAVFHSHISSPPRPSRTDVQNIGLWAGQPYLIYTVRTNELAAWRIVDGEIEPLPLTSPAEPGRQRLWATAGRGTRPRPATTPDYLIVNEPFMNGCGSQMNL